MYFNEGGSFETSSASNGPVNWILLVPSFCRNGKWETYRGRFITSVDRHNVAITSISTRFQEFFSGFTSESLGKSAGEIAKGKTTLYIPSAQRKNRIPPILSSHVRFRRSAIQLASPPLVMKPERLLWAKGRMKRRLTYLEKDDMIKVFYLT
jgi:hypothetical protein